MWSFITKIGTDVLHGELQKKMSKSLLDNKSFYATTLIGLNQICPTQMDCWAKNKSLSVPRPHTGWHINEGCTL